MVFMATTVINPVQKGVQDVDVTLPMGLVSVAHLDGQVTPVTKNVYLEHSVQIARQVVKDIVEIHVITLVECATADVKMVGWGHTAINLVWQGNMVQDVHIIAVDIVEMMILVIQQLGHVIPDVKMDTRAKCVTKVVKIMQIVCHLVMDIVSITFLAIQPMVTALVVVHPDMLDIIATKHVLLERMEETVSRIVLPDAMIVYVTVSTDLVFAKTERKDIQTAMKKEQKLMKKFHQAMQER